MLTATGTTADPTPFSSAWRYRWIVLFCVIVLGGTGLWYANQTQAYSATAKIAVQDPRSSIVFDQALRFDPERYVADQIEIINSRAVAAEASRLLADASSPIAVDAEILLQNATVTSAAATDLISISYSDPDPGTAIAITNAIADAYQTISRSSAEATFASVLAELDASIADLTAEQRSIQAQLDDQRGAAVDQIALEESLRAAIAEVLAFEFPDPTDDADAFATTTARLTELQQRVAILQTALAAIQEEQDVTQLEQELADVRSRLTALQLRRDQLAIDADLAGNGVIFFSPAVTAEQSSSTLIIALAVLSGLFIGAAIAQSLARRRRDFHSRLEPQNILGTSLISDVPIFGEERLPTALPSRDAPMSAAAEAFRFVATGIRLRQYEGNSESRFSTVVVASATLADGKTTVAANTAFAAARGGSRVAMIDADFVNPALTTMLLPESTAHSGLTDVAAGEVDLNSAGIEVNSTAGQTVTLFTRGTMAERIPDFFATEAAVNIVRAISKEFDLIVIDSPPVLRLAHGGSVVRLADRVLVVVAHRSNISLAEELERYLAVVGVPMLGYVYNFAPLRSEMLSRGGSVAAPSPDES